MPIAAALCLVCAHLAGPFAPDDTLYAAWRPLLAAELQRADARLQPQDVYKFLHQGVLGPAHAVTDTAAVRARLLREWQLSADLEAAGRPPLLLPLRPDGRLVRIDLVRLRQFVASRSAAADLAPPERADTAPAHAAALDTLALAVVATAAAWPLATEQLAALWSAVRRDAQLWSEHFDAAALQAFHAEVQGRWPVVHHGEAYRRQRQPHYRVVAVEFLPAAWRRAEMAP